MAKRHWQDWVHIALGAWLFFSPWIFGYNMADTAMTMTGAASVAAWSSHILGAAIALFGALRIYAPKLWEEWSAAIAGVFTLASPWLFGFAGVRDAMMNAVIVGAVVVGLAIWALATDVKLREKWEHHAH